MNFIQLAIRYPAEVPTSVRYWLANQIHALAVRLYDEQYWCNCGDPSCEREVGAPLICTSSYVRDLDNQWNALDLGTTGQLDTTPEAFPVFGQVETTNSYGIKLVDGHWFNYSMYGYTGNANLGHHPAEPGDVVNMTVVKSRANERYFIKTMDINL